MVDATSRDVFQRLIARGYSPVQAAALTGHGMQESSLNPNAFNPSEGAFGALQWRLDRRDNLNRFAGERGTKPNDLDTQLDFIRHEMMGPEAKAGGAFMAATDLPSAHAALRRYIRYGDNSDATRMAHAEKLLGLPPTTAAAAAPAAAPFSLAPGVVAQDPTLQNAANAVTPLLAMAKQVIAKNTQDEDQPIEPVEIAMAKPLGLNRINDLMAAMKRIRV
jgi:hypothetical protein